VVRALRLGLVMMTKTIGMFLVLAMVVGCGDDDESSYPTPSGSSSGGSSGGSSSGSSGGSSSGSSTSTSASSAITGSFTTTSEKSAGGTVERPMSLIQDGTSVSGEYIPSADPYGTIDGKMDGKTLVGEWIQGGARGPVKLTFSSDGSSFTGTWDYAGGSGTYSWTGKRTSTTPAKLVPSGTGASSGCKANSDCGSCQRCELSTGTCRSRLTC